MDTDHTEYESEPSFLRANTCALEKKRRGNCAVPLNNMFSQLLRLNERAQEQARELGGAGP
jgi:hypothetical protein